ncbi:hypothetical protein AVEN_137908-1 [Araneus ventricosus]|uniref:Secreted protein n=1 Tax=Araneus ventricosus TaxID=182803 RepID=A0A4Y2HW52_ARAVE|nr:hypothetical protein AVEN_137908-1 [Araneus ventricosus]
MSWGPSVLLLVWFPQPTSIDSPKGFRVHRSGRGAGVVLTTHVHRLTQRFRVHRGGRGAGVVRKFVEGFQFRCHPRHLTDVQNYEFQSKLGSVLLQNGA